MFRRFLRALTSTQPNRDPGPVRPNQLRREDVVLARRRAATPPTGAQSGTRSGARSSSTPQARPQPPATSPPGQPAPPATSIRAALTSRDGLRQAMLLREVLGPPVAMRDLTAWDPQTRAQPPTRTSRPKDEPQRP